MAFPCAHVYRFCHPAILERRGEGNARLWAAALNTRADTTGTNPNAGTNEIVDDPLGGDFKTLRQDSDLNPGTSNGADITVDLEWKRPGRADSGGATNNVQQFPVACVQAHGYIATASFGAASTGYVTLLNTADSTAATDRDFELRLFRDGSLQLVNRTTGPTVSLAAGTVPINSRFRFYMIYQANTTGTNGRVVLGVSTDDGETWTTASSTSASITNAPTRRIRLMFRAESTQVALLDSGVPEGCWDWVGVGTVFTGAGATPFDNGWTDADLIARTTYDPFFGMEIGGVTHDGFTVAMVAADDDFDTAALSIGYEVWSAPGDYGVEDEIPADPTATGTMVDSGTLTRDATTRFGYDRVTGQPADTWRFVRFEVEGVYSPWARVKTLHTAAQGRRTISIGVRGHIQNSADKRACLADGWMARRPLHRVNTVGKDWHGDNNTEQAPGASAAKMADLFLHARYDVFSKGLRRRCPGQRLPAEYEGGFTNIDSRYSGSATLMGAVDPNWNFDNTGSGGDRADNIVAGTAWTTYLSTIAATVGVMAVNEPTPGAMYYSVIEGRVKHIHLLERVHRTDAGAYLGETQIAWAEDEAGADDGCELVIVWSPSSWSDQDATADDSYGAATWLAERDDAIERIATAIASRNKRVLFVSDCKYTPFLLEAGFQSLVSAELRPFILGCAGLGKTAGRVPNAGYTLANWADGTDPLTVKAGVTFAYLPLADGHSQQNQVTCPVSAASTGVSTDDALMGWGELEINETARTVTVRAFQGTDGTLLSDNLYGTFEAELSYLGAGQVSAGGVNQATRLLLGI